MTTRNLVIWITFLAVFAMAARISVDTDTWWHLRAGDWILENRQVPQQDPFSYTRAGESWQYPGWLMEVPMALIYRATGPGGLNLWTALMVTVAFVFVYFTLSGGVFLRAFTLILAVAASGVYWAARPYLMTFVLTAVFLWIFEDFRWKRRDWLLVLPFLMVLWANSHGGFAVGFMLLGIYFLDALISHGLNVWQDSREAKVDRSGTLRKFVVLDRRTRKILFVGVLLVIAVAINPSGPVMLLYPFKTISIGALRDYIQEWQSPDFHEIQVQPFLWLLLLTFGAVGFSKKRLLFTDFVSVTFFAYLGFLAGRNIALFALVAPAVLTRYAAPMVEDLRLRLGIRDFLGQDRPLTRPVRILNIFILLSLLLVVIIKAVTVYPREINQDHFAEILPLEAVDQIRKEAYPGRLFNTYNWGGYLLWALPEYPVFIDGRTDLYNDEIIQAWLTVVRAEDGWGDILDRWDVDLVLVEPNLPLVDHLEGAGWQLLHSDPIAVVYGR